VKIQVKVFWVVTLCSVAVGLPTFRRTMQLTCGRSAWHLSATLDTQHGVVT